MYSLHFEPLFISNFRRRSRAEHDLPLAIPYLLRARLPISHKRLENY